MVVTDQNRCRDTAQVYVEKEGGFQIKTKSEDITCFPWRNGEAEVTVVSGGQAPFSYRWSTTPLQSGAMATNLSAGSYSVTVTDATGDSYTTDSIIISVDPMWAPE